MRNIRKSCCKNLIYNKNPKAVVSVMLRGEFKSYWSWSETASYDAIIPLMYPKSISGMIEKYEKD